MNYEEHREYAEEKFLKQELGAIPITISWSSLRLHEECRQKFKLHATGKRGPAADIRVFFPGTVADRVMRAWLSSPDPQLGQMVGMVEDIMTEEERKVIRTGEGMVRWRGHNDRPQVVKFCVDLVEKLEPILCDLVLPYEYQPEMRFSKIPMFIPGLDGAPALIYISGGIDIVTKEHTDTRDIWRAYDLKATRDDNYVKKTLGQGVFYDLAMRLMFGQSPDSFAFIQPLCSQRIVYARVTEEDRRVLVTRIERMAHYMWKHDYDPKADIKGCQWCDVKHACVKFKPAAGSRHRLTLGPVM
jgi:PD-(D/E)XK nuclease superfamily